MKWMPKNLLIFLLEKYKVVLNHYNRRSVFMLILEYPMLTIVLYRHCRVKFFKK